jgi:SARP family transcriptional regulator, regulator of embCAB operon
MVRVGLLGPVAINGSSGFRSIRATKVRGLLAVLALNPQTVVSFEELIDEFWPVAALNNPRNALQANALRLRNQLEALLHQKDHVPADEILLTSGSGYVLDVPPDEVDVGQFEELTSAGGKLVKDRPREALVLLENAMKLWRGPALADVGDGLRCRAAATKLSERRLSVKVDLLDARLALGGDPGLIGDLREMVVRYPERERLSELLMVALYREGRQTEALNIFHQTRQWLIRELGSEPTHMLWSRYQAILGHEQMLTSGPSLLLVRHSDKERISRKSSPTRQRLR